MVYPYQLALITIPIIIHGSTLGPCSITTSSKLSAILTQHTEDLYDLPIISFDIFERMKTIGLYSIWQASGWGTLILRMRVKDTANKEYSG